MNYLIDTNILIASQNDSSKLSKAILDIINLKENNIFVSYVSFWEIVLKRKLGKLKIEGDIFDSAKKSNFDFLQIGIQHIFETENLPLHHSDPFDRLLIAQARVENLTLITLDKIFSKYKVKLLK